jgi:hypothetical protein
MTDDGLVILTNGEKLKRKLFGHREKAPRVQRPQEPQRIVPEGSPELIGLKAAHFDLLKDLATMKYEKEKLESRFNEMAVELQAKDAELVALLASTAKRDEDAAEFMEQFVSMLGSFKKKRGRKAWKHSKSVPSAEATKQ